MFKLIIIPALIMFILSCVPYLYEVKGIFIGGNDRLKIIACDERYLFDDECFPIVQYIYVSSCDVQLKTEIDSKFILISNNSDEAVCKFSFLGLSWNEELNYYYYNIGDRESGSIVLKVFNETSKVTDIVNFEYKRVILSREIVIDAI